MNQPSSSTLVSLNFFPCQVCGLPGHGNHFGCVSCRACAAFFRRAASQKTSTYKCKKGQNSCPIWENGRFFCKKCRLEKCYQVGMDSTKFQFDRDPISGSETIQVSKKLKMFQNEIPTSVELFLGQPHLLLLLGPSFSATKTKNYIDCQYLIERASKLLMMGSEKPLFGKSSLEKLALGLNIVRDPPADELKLITKLGKDEAFTFWERDFLQVARWMTYFDEFQMLDHSEQMLLVKSVWHVWGRLDKLAITAIGRKKFHHNNNNMIMVSQDSVLDVKNVELDISWFTKYSRDQIAYFVDDVDSWMVMDVLEPLVQLQPTDIELTFMLCQLCFHYAGKRLQGDILTATERFLEKLSNELHEYYTNELNMPRYCGRLAQLMKINNQIQKDIWEKRAKSEVAKILDIFCVEFSHPEMFLDSGC